MKKSKGKIIFISSFIVLLLLAGLGFLRFGPYKVVVVRGDAETEEHDEHEREQHIGKISEVHSSHEGGHDDHAQESHRRLQCGMTVSKFLWNTHLSQPIRPQNSLLMLLTE